MASELRGLAARLALAGAAALCATGCLGVGSIPKNSPITPRGYLFTWATVPLTRNYRHTPVVDSANGYGSIFHLEYSYWYIPFSLDWGDNSIGGLAKEAGFDEVYYADMTTISVWTVFRMQRVRVYGHPQGLPGGHSEDALP